MLPATPGESWAVVARVSSLGSGMQHARPASGTGVSVGRSTHQTGVGGSVPWIKGDQPLSLQPPEKGQELPLVAPGATSIILSSQLVEQLLSQAPPVAPGETVISSQLSAQLLAQLPLVAPGAASVLQEPQQSPLVAPGAASWLWVELQPVRAKAAARVAAVKRVFIE